MKWNWQQPDWPRFSWSIKQMAKAEEQFLIGSGVILGAVNHLSSQDRLGLTVELLSEEAATSSEIEGEILDRDSIQSSISRELGLATDSRRRRPAEQGIAEMMVDLYQNFAGPLNKRELCSWHRLLMQENRNIQEPGSYRTHVEPMRVVSGKLHDPQIHFEAPPSSEIPMEMAAFLDWFNGTGPTSSNPLPALTRSGIAHLYFESIHPFADGNGRIGRAISEKALAQGAGGPTLTALAATILIRRREYYRMLEASNKQNEISKWLAWFAGIALEAQQRTLSTVEFLINKAKLLDRVKDHLSERQLKVLLRVLREGLDGFKGGLSAGNYVKIAKISPATATRDLADLVEKGAFIRTGERRHARYHLNVPLRPVPRFLIDLDGKVITDTH